MNRAVGQTLLVGVFFFVGIAFVEIGFLGVSFASEMPALRAISWLAAFAFWIYLPYTLLQLAGDEQAAPSLGAIIGWSALVGVLTSIIWAFVAYGLLRAGAAYFDIPWLALTLLGGFLDGVGLVLRRAQDLGTLIVVMLIGAGISAAAGLIWNAIVPQRQVS